MHPISDDELVLYHYCDGLDAARARAIDDALKADASLRRRCELLRAVLQASDLDQPPEPASRFEVRLQQHVAALTGEPPPPRGRSAAIGTAHYGAARRPRWRPYAAAAASLLLLVIGFQLGRESALQPPVTAAQLDGTRVYQATLARHLGSTRRALLIAAHDGPAGFGPGNAALAGALIENNRLYLAAAEASGDRRLVELLRALEPVLIELANPVDADDIELRKGVSDYLERSDLLFQVRAAEAGLRARTPLRT